MKTSLTKTRKNTDSNKIIEEMKDLVGVAKKKLEILKCSSVHTKISYESEYSGYYKVIEQAMEANENLNYVRIIQTPLNFQGFLKIKNKEELLSLMMEHIIMDATIEHLFNCIKYKDRFQLYIVTARTPYSLIQIDEKDVYRKIDQWNSNEEQDFKEIDKLTGTLARDETKIFNEIYKSSKSYSTKELLQGLKEYYNNLEKELDEKKEQIDSLRIQMTTLILQKFDSKNSEKSREGQHIKSRIKELMSQIEELHSLISEYEEKYTEMKSKTGIQLLYQEPELV